jgi:hypothetical protein
VTKQPSDAGVESAFAAIERSLTGIKTAAGALAKKAGSAAAPAKKGDIEKLRASSGEVFRLRERLIEELRALEHALDFDFAAALKSPRYGADVSHAAAALKLSHVRGLEGRIYAYPLVVIPDGTRLTIDKKTVTALRPAALAALLAAELAKKPSSTLNRAFVDAIEEVYLGLTEGAYARSVPMAEVHEKLTPLPDHRRAYPLNSFAADLHALEVKGLVRGKRGRTISFPASTSLRAVQAVRLIGADGIERVYASVRFD